MQSSWNAIDPDLAIDCYGDKPVGFNILELHDPMPIPGKLTPATGLLRILLNGLVLPAARCECHSS